MPVTTPPLIPQPFAQSGDRTAIPNTTATLGRASYSAGFPAETMQPKVSGGVPPDGRDMNGILYALSAHAAYTQAGQPYKYDSTVVAAISGYAVGTVLGSSDGSTLWLNLSAGNVTDPDASGAGWIPLASYGYSTITGLTGGLRTLTLAEARYKTLVLSGTLVANQNVVLPTTLSSWRIVNLTTGSFTTTVKTAGGTGVVVHQGGYSASIGVFGNGTDIYLEVPAVALPIAVTATPDTIAKRDNVGDLFARYFNGSSSPEAVTVANVMVTNAIDGYLRKISLANLLLQALVDAALTGTPTAPTAAAGTNTTQIASTAFVQQSTIGNNQTWQNVLFSRTKNTLYTNSTNKPIMVSISTNLEGVSPNEVSLLVDGITVASMDGANASSDSGSVCAIVPNGSQYILSSSTSTVILAWAELR